jgi:hypothetical protein
MCWCFFRLLLLLNDLLHTSQEYECFLYCMHPWLFSVLCRVNDFWHMSQMYGRSSPYMGWCSLRGLWWGKKRTYIRINVNRMKNEYERLSHVTANYKMEWCSTNNVQWNTNLIRHFGIDFSNLLTTVELFHMDGEADRDKKDNRQFFISELMNI